MNKIRISIKRVINHKKKAKQTEILQQKSTITELKNSKESFNNRLCKLEDRTREIKQNEKSKGSLPDL